MTTVSMKLASAISLLAAAMWTLPPGLELLIDVLVSVGALAVATQAAASSRKFWAAGFVAIAVLFNPLVPVVLPRGVFFWLDLVCVVVFMVSLETLKGLPGLSFSSSPNRKSNV
ncbi:MAG TPA: DUF6804 family protein [Terriglobia bacterium]|nr:DUF6804 family protein [Terriglobia bacterium]